MIRASDEEHRAATQLELFFDLYFVVAVAALARDLHGDPTILGVLRFTGLFVLVGWAWMASLGTPPPLITMMSSTG